MGMHGFSDVAWMLLALISGFGVLQILRSLAIRVRNETMIHDLQVGVSRIQIEQFHAQMLRLGLTPHNQTTRATDPDEVPTDPATPDQGMSDAGNPDAAPHESVVNADEIPAPQAA